MISLQFINKYVYLNKVQPSEHLITFNLYKFVRLMVISILIERNISDEPSLLLAVYIFADRWRQYRASTQHNFVQHLFFIYLIDINSV